MHLIFYIKCMNYPYLNWLFKTHLRLKTLPSVSRSKMPHLWIITGRGPVQRGASRRPVDCLVLTAGTLLCRTQCSVCLLHSLKYSGIDFGWWCICHIHIHGCTERGPLQEVETWPRDSKAQWGQHWVWWAKNRTVWLEWALCWQHILDGTAQPADSTTLFPGNRGIK